MQCIVGSPEGKHFKNVSNLSHSTTQTVVFYVRKRCGKNSETDRNKSAQYKVKSRHYKWCLLETQPRPQSFSLKKWVGREKLFPPHPFFKGKALGTRLLETENIKKNATNFSSTHVRICIKDATPLSYDFRIFFRYFYINFKQYLLFYRFPRHIPVSVLLILVNKLLYVMEANI